MVAKDRENKFLGPEDPIRAVRCSECGMLNPTITTKNSVDGRVRLSVPQHKPLPPSTHFPKRQPVLDNRLWADPRQTDLRALEQLTIEQSCAQSDHSHNSLGIARPTPTGSSQCPDSFYRSESGLVSKRIWLADNRFRCEFPDRRWPNRHLPDRSFFRFAAVAV